MSLHPHVYVVEITSRTYMHKQRGIPETYAGYLSCFVCRVALGPKVPAHVKQRGERTCPLWKLTSHTSRPRQILAVYMAHRAHRRPPRLGATCYKKGIRRTVSIGQACEREANRLVRRADTTNQPTNQPLMVAACRERQPMWKRHRAGLGRR